MKFYKYQGTGNDFIIFDDREEKFPLHDTKLIARLCDRRFGIGADGLMLLRNEPGYDFRMIYYNADGNESSMCGNGGRCMARFAQSLGIIKNHTTFIATDGSHEAKLDDQVVQLKMQDVSGVESHENYAILNTGSPHYVLSAADAQNMNIIAPAKDIRYNETFRKEGINVNFIEWKDSFLYVRTYERGVEDETLSCGTGVTAAAIAHSIMSKTLSGSPQQIPILTPGGQLEVHFQYLKDANKFVEVWLIGPAKLVFSGEVNF